MSTPLILRMATSACRRVGESEGSEFVGARPSTGPRLGPLALLASEATYGCTTRAGCLCPGCPRGPRRRNGRCCDSRYFVPLTHGFAFAGLAPLPASDAVPLPRTKVLLLPEPPRRLRNRRGMLSSGSNAERDSPVPPAPAPPPARPLCCATRPPPALIRCTSRTLSAMQVGQNSVRDCSSV